MRVKRFISLSLAIAMIALIALTGISIPPVEAAPGNIPHKITVTIYGDPRTQMGFTWWTASNVTDSDLQVVPKKGSEQPDFTGNDVLSFTGTSGTSDVLTQGIWHKAVATGLKPGTTYWFRVGSAKDGYWSNVGSFTTDRSTPGPFTFVAMTDTQQSTSVGANTWKKAFETYPEAKFLMHGGDIIDNGDNYTQWEEILDYSAPAIMNLPTVNASAPWHTDQDYVEYHHFNYKLPEGANYRTGQYYSFNYGNALFVVLNTYAGSTKDHIDQAQLNWLKDQLANTKMKWKIVMSHMSPYGFGKNRNNVQSFSDTILPIINEYGVDLYLSGHDHVYVRTHAIKNNAVQLVETVTREYGGEMLEFFLNPDGTYYQVMGTASVKTYELRPDLWAAEQAFIAEQQDMANLQSFFGITIDSNKLMFKGHLISQLNNITLRDSFNILKQATPEEVIARIADLPAEVTPEHKAEVVIARQEYDSLDEQGKQAVTNYNVLLAAEEALFSEPEELEVTAEFDKVALGQDNEITIDTGMPEFNGTYTVTISGYESFDYVKDGLVLWLDGIRNKRNGSRDTSSTTWEDLSGNNYDITVPINENSSWTATDNAYRFHHMGDTRILLADESFNTGLLDTFKSEQFTLDFYFSTYKSGDGVDDMSQAREKNILDSNSSWFCMYHTTWGSYVMRFLTHQEKGIANNPIVEIPWNVEGNTIEGNTNTISWHLNNESAWRVNGQVIGASNNPFIPTYQMTKLTYVSIGKSANDLQYSLKADINSFRVYNRALTAEEAARNTLIDKNRFEGENLFGKFAGKVLLSNQTDVELEFVDGVAKADLSLELLGEGSNIEFKLGNATGSIVLDVLEKVVDKTELNQAIEDAEELEDKEEDYTPATWALFALALEDAREVDADEGASQEDVDAATQALLTAMENLVERADKSELEGSIEDAQELEEKDYAPVTWGPFEEALDHAIEVYEDANATQKEVDDALTALIAAMEDLVLLGDVNGDGKIATVDALQVLKYVSERVEFNEVELSAADVNRSEDVTSQDALWILQYVSEKKDSF